MMKYRKRFVIYNLIGLIALINSCTIKKNSLQLIHSTEINFPSASAIEFYDNRLYVFGDDASSLFILAPDYQIVDSIPFWEPYLSRIKKEDKHDIESAMIMEEQGKAVLFGIGSMSDKNRWEVFKYQFISDSFTRTRFYETSQVFPDLSAVNIEGSCVINNTIVFSNRANLSSRVNHLLVWEGGDSIRTIKFILPSTKIVAGVSGLYYVRENDMLLFTASEEATESTIADGAIGDSYLGWVENFSKKMKQPESKPDKFLKLGEVDAVFAKQKVESVCVEKINSDEMIIHLVADNDNGKSRLFKMKLSL